MNPDAAHVQLFICVFRNLHYSVRKLHDTRYLSIYKTQERNTLHVFYAEARLYIILGIFLISSGLVFINPFALILSLVY